MYLIRWWYLTRTSQSECHLCSLSFGKSDFFPSGLLIVIYWVLWKDFQSLEWFLLWCVKQTRLPVSQCTLNTLEAVGQLPLDILVSGSQKSIKLCSNVGLGRTYIIMISQFHGILLTRWLLSTLEWLCFSALCFFKQPFAELLMLTGFLLSP